MTVRVSKTVYEKVLPLTDIQSKLLDTVFGVLSYTETYSTVDVYDGLDFFQELWFLKQDFHLQKTLKLNVIHKFIYINYETKNVGDKNYVRKERLNPIVVWDDKTSTSLRRKGKPFFF